MAIPVCSAPRADLLQKNDLLCRDLLKPGARFTLQEGFSRVRALEVVIGTLVSLAVVFHSLSYLPYLRGSALLSHASILGATCLWTWSRRVLSHIELPRDGEADPLGHGEVNEDGTTTVLPSQTQPALYWVPQPGQLPMHWPIHTGSEGTGE